MKRLIAILLSVVTVVGLCTFVSSAAADPKGEADFIAYRLDKQPKLDGIVSAGEYYVLAGKDAFSGKTANKTLYAGYDDDYLYLAAQIECKGHVNSWYYTENGEANVDGRDIYNGHSVSIGLLSESPKSGDQVKGYIAAGDTSWVAGYNSCIARLFHLALTDNYYRFKLCSDYGWFGGENHDNWGKWFFGSYFNGLCVDYQLSGVGYSHVASTAAPSGGSTDDLIFVDEKTGAGIQYNTANLAEDSYRSDAHKPDTYYPQKLFIVSHNGYTGLNIHDGKSTFDPETGKYDHADSDGNDYYQYNGYGDESVDNGADIDTYEMYIPWKWIDYRTSNKRKDELSKDNTEKYDEFAVLNTRQQQLQLGERTTDGSLYYKSDKHTNSATEACDKTADGTYFGLYVDLRSGGDASNLTPFAKCKFEEMSAEDQKAYCADWVKYSEDFYANGSVEENEIGNGQSDLGSYKTVYLAGKADADAIASTENSFPGQEPKPTDPTTTDPTTTDPTTTTTGDNGSTTGGDSSTDPSANQSTTTTTKKQSNNGNGGNTNTPTTTTKPGNSTETGDGTTVAIAIAVVAGLAVLVLSTKKKRV